MMMGGSSSGSSPVEQVLMFPLGTAAVSSAGPIIRVWDIVAGGSCLKAISNHQKTVTSLTFNADASRLLTGGLDHMVKVYDVSNYKVVHTMRYPAPILCLAISVRVTLFIFYAVLMRFTSRMKHILLVECLMGRYLYVGAR
jgi:U3 small nucleolar RNA-associated protein 15